MAITNISQNETYGTPGGVASISFRKVPKFTPSTSYKNLARITSSGGISNPIPVAPEGTPENYQQRQAGIFQYGTMLGGGQGIPTQTQFMPPLTTRGNIPLPPDYGKFADPMSITSGGQNISWGTPTSPVIRNLPGDTSGQYVADLEDPNKLVKTIRGSNPMADTAMRAGRPGSMYTIDHIIPLSLGGADTLANRQLLTFEQNDQKTKSQAVPYTLYAHGKIPLNDARVMGMQWKDRDLSDVPLPDKIGLLPLEIAQQTAERWTKPRPVRFKDVMAGIPEASKNLGKGWLPDPIREFVKGAASGVTMNFIPYEQGEDQGVVSKVAGIGGVILGTLAPFSLAVKVLAAPFAAVRGASYLFGARRATAVAEAAANGFGAAEKISMIRSLNKAPGYVAKFLSDPATINQLGKFAGGSVVFGQAQQFVANKFNPYTLSGEATETEQKNMIGNIFRDLALGVFPGVASPTLKGTAYATIAPTTLALWMNPDDPVEALTMGVMFGVMHGKATYKKPGFNDVVSFGGKPYENPVTLAYDHVMDHAAYKSLGYYNPESMPEVPMNTAVPKLSPVKIEQAKNNAINNVWQRYFFQRDATSQVQKTTLNRFKEFSRATDATLGSVKEIPKLSFFEKFSPSARRAKTAEIRAQDKAIQEEFGPGFKNKTPDNMPAGKVDITKEQGTGRPLFRGVSKAEGDALLSGKPQPQKLDRNVYGEVIPKEFTLTTSDPKLAKHYSQYDAVTRKPKIDGGYVIEYKPNTISRSQPSISKEAGSIIIQKSPNEFYSKDLTLSDVARVTDKNGKVIYEATTPESIPLVPEEGMDLQTALTEIKRITISGRQLYKGTLSAELRGKADLDDLLSFGKMLKDKNKTNLQNRFESQIRFAGSVEPVINSPVARQAVETLMKADPEFMRKSTNYSTTEPSGKYPLGDIALTGAAATPAGRAKAKYYFEQKDLGNASPNVVLVRRPDLGPLFSMENNIRTLQQIKAGEYAIDANPQHAIQAFGIVKNPQTGGIELVELGMVASDHRLNLGTAKDHVAYNQHPGVKEYIATNGEKGMKPLTPENHKDTIARAMEKHGLDTIIVNISPDATFATISSQNPYIPLKMNEENWMRSLELKGYHDSQPAVNPISVDIAKVNSALGAKEIVDQITRMKNNPNRIKPASEYIPKQVTPVNLSTNRLYIPQETTRTVVQKVENSIDVATPAQVKESFKNNFDILLTDAQAQEIFNKRNDLTIRDGIELLVEAKNSGNTSVATNISIDLTQTYIGSGALRASPNGQATLDLPLIPKKKYSGVEDTLPPAIAENYSQRLATELPAVSNTLEQVSGSRETTTQPTMARVTPQDIHNLADSKNIPWDNNKAFMESTKRVTGKEHLDDLTGPELKAVYDAINTRNPVTQNTSIPTSVTPVEPSGNLADRLVETARVEGPRNLKVLPKQLDPKIEAARSMMEENARQNATLDEGQPYAANKDQLTPGEFAQSAWIKLNQGKIPQKGFERKALIEQIAMEMERAFPQMEFEQALGFTGRSLPELSGMDESYVRPPLTRPGSLSGEYGKFISEGLKMDPVKRPQAHYFAKAFDKGLQDMLGINYKKISRLTSVLDDYFKDITSREFNYAGKEITQPADVLNYRATGERFKEIAAYRKRTDEVKSNPTEDGGTLSDADLARLGVQPEESGFLGMNVRPEYQDMNMVHDLTAFENLVGGLFAPGAKQNGHSSVEAIKDLFMGDKTTMGLKDYIISRIPSARQSVSFDKLIAEAKANDIKSSLASKKNAESIKMAKQQLPTLERNLRSAEKALADPLERSNWESKDYLEEQVAEITAKMKKFSKIIEELNTKDGGGGPGVHDGKGGMLGDAWSSIKKTAQGVGDFFSGTTSYEAPVEPLIPKPKTYSVRGVDFTDDDLDQYSRIFLGEVSNRTDTKKGDMRPFEVRHIVNTGINRVLAKNPGEFGGTLREVFERPGAYQSYAPKGIHKKGGKEIIESEYQRAVAGKLDYPTQQKLKIIRETLEEMKNPEFTDPTGGAKFYVHATDGTLWLGKTTEEAQARAHEYEKKTGIAISQFGTANGMPARTSSGF